MKQKIFTLTFTILLLTFSTFAGEVDGPGRDTDSPCTTCSSIQEDNDNIVNTILEMLLLK